jgi:hypothetical protein
VVIREPFPLDEPFSPLPTARYIEHRLDFPLLLAVHVDRLRRLLPSPYSIQLKERDVERRRDGPVALGKLEAVGVLSYALKDLKWAQELVH